MAAVRIPGPTTTLVAQTGSLLYCRLTIGRAVAKRSGRIIRAAAGCQPAIPQTTTLRSGGGANMRPWLRGRVNSGSPGAGQDDGAGAVDSSNHFKFRIASVALSWSALEARGRNALPEPGSTICNVYSGESLLSFRRAGMPASS